MRRGFLRHLWAGCYMWQRLPRVVEGIFLPRGRWHCLQASGGTPGIEWARTREAVPPFTLDHLSEKELATLSVLDKQWPAKKQGLLSSSCYTMPLTTQTSSPLRVLFPLDLRPDVAAGGYRRTERVLEVGTLSKRTSSFLRAPRSMRVWGRWQRCWQPRASLFFSLEW